MKTNRWLFFTTVAMLILYFIPFSSKEVLAMTTPGEVTITPSEKTDPLDPEDPLVPVDPGESPSTEGDLRIDFVSTVNFADAKITETNRKYNALGQLFHSETKPRANYIQVTDLREGTPGWSLQLKQNSQFKNENNIELNGSVLSFDNGWANSGGTGQEPIVFRDTISIDAIGNAYSVATASEGSGNGTWLVSFGASESNELNQKNTLSLLKDSKGEGIIDESYGKEMVTNTAITLSVPDKTAILAGEYGTELTWLLQATP